MKATGVVRKLDDLGRVVFPISLRRHFTLNDGDAVEIFVSDGAIVLRKYEPACIFCGEVHGVTIYRGSQGLPGVSGVSGAEAGLGDHDVWLSSEGQERG